MLRYCHYQIDIGEVYHYLPYQAYLDTSIEINNAEDVEDLIPPSIEFMEARGIPSNCLADGIRPRYLEVFDVRSNRYIIECPKPFLLLPTLIDELNNNSKIKGWVGHGEKVFHRRLVTL